MSYFFKRREKVECTKFWETIFTKTWTLVFLFVELPDPSLSYILKAQRSFSSGDPLAVMSVAIINSWQHQILNQSEQPYCFLIGQYFQKSKGECVKHLTQIVSCVLERKIANRAQGWKRHLRPNTWKVIMFWLIFKKIIIIIRKRIFNIRVELKPVFKAYRFRALFYFEYAFV